MRGWFPEVYPLSVSEHIRKRHNKTLLLYHLVCPIKYRKKLLTPSVEKALKDACLEIQLRYEIQYIEIGSDQDHVHFLIQSVPTLSPTDIVQTTKGLTAKYILNLYPEITDILWGGHFWTSGFYMNTVGQYANEEVIKRYVQNQGLQYTRIYRTQLSLFDL